MSYANKAVPARTKGGMHPALGIALGLLLLYAYVEHGRVEARKNTEARCDRVLSDLSEDTTISEGQRAALEWVSQIDICRSITRDD